MTTLTINWLQKCCCGNKTHTVESLRGNPYRLWDDDSVRCNSCGREGIIQVTEGFARVLWETDEEQAERKSMTLTKDHHHPAHSPLTSSRLHQMRDILSKAAAQRDGGDIGYAMSDAVKLIDEAIAAFGVEPVAWTEKCEITNMQATGLYLRGFPDNSHGRDIALYTTPPAPVVQEELLSAMEEVLRISDRDHEAWHRARNGISACRAAILQACNSPAVPDVSVFDDEFYRLVDERDDQIEGGQMGESNWNALFEAAADAYLATVAKCSAKSDEWIKCSERMPEEGQEVIVMDVNRGKVQSGMIYEDGQFVDFNELYYEVVNPSHWMPLPAAPRLDSAATSSNIDKA